MKAAIIALIGFSNGIALKQQYLVSGGAEVQEGIPDKSLMDKQPSFSRKIWPQGVTDDGNQDAETLNMFLDPHAASPPSTLHRWVPYEPHTTSNDDQFTNLYHVKAGADDGEAKKNDPSDMPEDDE